MYGANLKQCDILQARGCTRIKILDKTKCARYYIKWKIKMLIFFTQKQQEFGTV